MTIMLPKIFSIIWAAAHFSGKKFENRKLLYCQDKIHGSEPWWTKALKIGL
jgi:hypothetical protein